RRKQDIYTIVLQEPYQSYLYQWQSGDYARAQRFDCMNNHLPIDDSRKFLFIFGMSVQKEIVLAMDTLFQPGS
ncbi:MAG: hypothetical protein AB1649_16130, partial [Chloroflexota bacterium]